MRRRDAMDGAGPPTDQRRGAGRLRAGARAHAEDDRVRPARSGNFAAGLGRGCRRSDRRDRQVQQGEQIATRDETVRSLGGRTVDLLVIGGGVIGAGIARDAALRGLEVALVEQADFGSGTTSRPTRLIHGGLRYLELFDFALVRSDMREREILLRIASHLVFPLPFLLPLYRPTFLYQLKLRLGMQLYDLLSLDKSLPKRQHLDRSATLAAEPSLEPDGLAGAWRFYDAQVPLVERLVVENLVDASAHGASVLNHARVIDFLREDDRVVGSRVRDTIGGGDLDIGARFTVIATGPWLDRTIAPLRKRSDPLLRLTKGVHIVTRRAVEHAHVLFARSDGRLFFVVPWLGARPADLAARPGDLTLDAATRAHLTSIYGARAREVLDLARADPSLASPLCSHHRGMEAEVVHAVRNEWARSLGDVLLRRTALGLAPCQALDCVERVADRAGAVLGWDKDRRRTEIEAYRREVEPMRRFSTE